MKRKVERKQLTPRFTLLLALMLAVCSILPSGYLSWLNLRVHAATFTVTNANDSGAGSLRQAILDANASPGADLITFNIPGSGVHTIHPTTGFPDVVGPVTIDGYTQPGASANTLAVGNNAVLRIEIEGSGAVSSSGLTLAGTGATVRGLVINRFTNSSAIRTTEGSSGHLIVGNFIGTDANGAIDLGNENGISLFRTSNNLIGGTAPADRNVISGNNNNGIALTQGDGNHVIQGNYVGTNAAGTAAVGNSTPAGGAGIFIGTNNVLVGGTVAGAANVISGNVGQGIGVTTDTSVTIQGNLIGTNASGTAAVANNVGVGGGGNPRPMNILIGGTVPGAGNVISGNTTDGLQLADAPGAVVQGNLIGVALDGVSPLGNGSDGIRIGFATGGFFGGGPTLVGGTAAGAGNLIGNNGQNGIRATCCQDRPSSFLGNNIFANGGLGIDIGAHVNDTGDTDGGTNNGQNFPTLTSISNNGGSSMIQGTLNSLANTTFRIEFFSNSACDGSGRGEGRNFISATSVTTDTSGNASINATLPSLVTSGFITATATRLDSGGNGTDTSEFSTCFEVSPPMPGQFQFSSPTYVVAESDGSATITVTRTGGSDGAVSVNFATANVTATEGSDYTSASGALNFAAGETSKTFTVMITEDSSFEGDETLSLTLTDPTGGSTLGTPNTAVLTIKDNDCSPSPAGLIAWYAGDGNADDIQGPTFEHGTQQGGVTFAPGQVGQAFTFDGVDDSVDLGSWFNLQTFTIEMWLKSEASQVAYADIIDNNHTDFRSWVVQYQNTGALYQYGSSDGVISFNLTPGQWQHLAITRDANRVSSVYLDGNLVGSVTGAGPLVYDGTQFLRLANWGGGGRNWKGQQDEVEIFDRALSQTEIQAIVNARSTGRCKPSPAQFSLSNYSTGEGDGRVNLVVTRATGATAATVDYSSGDSAGLTNCNVVNGIASSRCDYATSVGRLSFAVGEVSKTFSIPIVDDSYAEGSENFTVVLGNFIGVTLGNSSTATVTINDNDTTDGPTPIDGTAFFVRQHYIDFLNREPDPPGYAAWQAVINNCPAGDTTCDRIHVSSAFFRSPEFQERGYFVYRFYSVSFGRKPDYAEFIPDLARVSGFLSPAELEAAKLAFIDNFMTRPAFASVYNSLNNTQYVDTLLATAGITSASRDAWIAGLTNSTKTRAQVLREIAESTDVYNKYFNQAFVVMQYFGYLRRDPDALYINWIQVLDTTGDFRGMVTGFVTSLEYRRRFGP